VRSSSEWSFIKGFLSQMGYASTEVWIGGSDELVEGSWKWTDGSSVSYGTWMNGQPNQDGDCLLIDGGTYWDRGCSENHVALCKLV